jgi:acetyl-CoA C-acetyltransferase
MATTSVRLSPRTLGRVAILGGSRTPFTKSFGKYMKLTNQDLMTATLQNLVQKFNLTGQTLGDVALGAVMKSSFDWNLAREVVLGSGLSRNTPAYDVQRACGTSLETAWQIGLKIGAGQIQVGIAGGTDTNSDLPVMASRELSWKLLDLQNARTLGERLKIIATLRPHDLVPKFPGVVEPRTHLSMGEHTEKMVKEWNITRGAQDELALRSHAQAAKAYKEGFFKNLVFPFHGVEADTFVRGDTSMEKLARLKPAFDKSGTGTLTAGNSTPLTDGAAAVLMSSEEWAKSRAVPVQAYLADVEVAAVDFVAGAGLLMAPTVAVTRLLDRNGLKLQDFDYYEIHEAFAGQVLCTLRAWESQDYCREVLGHAQPLGTIDRERLNVKGSSLAVGHPFAATGARIIATLAQLLNEKGSGRGLISICTAGGMGIAAILEK